MIIWTVDRVKLSTYRLVRGDDSAYPRPAAAAAAAVGAVEHICDEHNQLMQLTFSSSNGNVDY